MIIKSKSNANTGYLLRSESIMGQYSAEMCLEILKNPERPKNRLMKKHILVDTFIRNC